MIQCYNKLASEEMNKKKSNNQQDRSSAIKQSSFHNPADSCSSCGKKLTRKLAVEDTETGKLFCSLSCLINNDKEEFEEIRNQVRKKGFDYQKGEVK